MDRSEQVVLSQEEYRALALRVFASQGWLCAGCGRGRDLQLHHLSSRGLAGGHRRDTEENTRGLCRECHPVWDTDRDSKFVRE